MYLDLVDDMIAEVQVELRNLAEDQWALDRKRNQLLRRNISLVKLRDLAECGHETIKIQTGVEV